MRSGRWRFIAIYKLKFTIPVQKRTDQKNKSRATQSAPAGTHGPHAGRPAETARDAAVRAEYRELIRYWTRRDAIARLADEYCRGRSTIERIIYLKSPP